MIDFQHEPDESHDEAFEARLKQLVPAAASSEMTSGESLSAESLVYQAGYRAACLEFDLSDADTPNRVSLSTPPQHRTRASRWLPTLAASLLTAMLTIPISYRAGNHANPDSRQLAVGESKPRLIDIAEADSPPPEALPTPPEPEVSSPVLSIQLFDPTDLLVPDWKRRAAHASMLTAHTQPESIEQSSWVSLESESVVRRRTFAAGDVHDASFDLHF